MGAAVTSLDIYRTAIPMRAFEHAASRRELAEAVVVRLGFSDGLSGWGEALPRPYVTGEGLDGVAADLEQVFWPLWAGRALEVADGLEGLPQRDGTGRCLNAAACAIDLAALRRLFGPAGRPGQFLADLAGAGGPHRRIAARVSGVLGSSDPDRTARSLRLMRWFGLRDFKLKCGLGREADRANLQAALRQLGRALRTGRCTLRVDVNGGWDADTTPQRVAELAAAGVCLVEQPVFAPAEALLELAGRCTLPLMADESLLTEQDARTLCREPLRVCWNIRLSKNGGFARCLKLARLAAERGVSLTVGCMVGESSLLSACQRLLLQWAPTPRFVEGNYGRFLLADDLTRRSLRFGFGGRLSVLRGGAAGLAPDPAKLARYGRLVANLTTH
jgi:muconate cycloisomerase